MQVIEIITGSSKETKKAGCVFAATLEKELVHSNRALILALEGDLGSGKTAFIQGLAEGFKIKENVLSPTFVIQKNFSLMLDNYKDFYHIDAYRLKNPEELLELGFKDLIKNPENIIAIEWADKIKKILPKEILRIKFKDLGKNIGKNKRKIIICF